MPGDVYCVECGAQLAGRFYRLQEFTLAASDDSSLIAHQATTDDRQPNDNGTTVYGPESEVSVSISDSVENGPTPVVEDASADTEALPIRPAINIAPAILENRVVGVAHVYEVWADGESQRAYVSWEEASGRTLASWLPESSALDELLSTQSGYLAVPQEPEEEQALAWMLQAAELLSRLHDEGIGWCSLELANLLVQPGDRVLLLDPAGCSMTEKMSMAEHDAM